MITNFKRLRNIAAAAALTLVSTASFATGLPFTVDPGSNGLSPITSTFTADLLNGVSTARITKDETGAFNYTGVGYIQYNSFSLDSSSVNAGVSGVNNQYGLYATFTQTFVCSGLLGPGTQCSVSTIDLGLYADKGANDTFTKASLTTAPSVTNTAGDVLLGNVTKVFSGYAGVTPLAGAIQNVNTNFVLTPEGMNYFVGPVPFYSLAFSGFQNTSQGLACNVEGCFGATVFAITSEGGTTDFNVPEPAPLALMGLGMLGLVGLRRKQAKK